MFIYDLSRLHKEIMILEYYEVEYISLIVCRIKSDSQTVQACQELVTRGVGRVARHGSGSSKAVELPDCPEVILIHICATCDNYLIRASN